MAENEPIETPVTDDGDWRDSLAGDNLDRLEQLNQFESPDKLFEHYDSLENRNWRDEYAGDDDKFKSTLERFNTPADMGKAFREAQGKIRSGQFREAPGSDATDDDIRAYREANGIPLEAAGYLDNLPEGLVLGEEDRAIFQDFANVLHEMNVPPSVGHAVIDWYNNFTESAQDEIAELDAMHHQQTEDTLRQEWAGDYRANINLIGSLLEAQFGEEVKDALLNARDPAGRAIMNIPGVLEGFANISRQLNPIAQLTQPSGDPQQTLDAEIAELEKYMKDDRQAYNKDESAQARLRQLYDIRIKHQESQRKSA